jgi:hypothetical protein
LTNFGLLYKYGYVVFNLNCDDELNAFQPPPVRIRISRHKQQMKHSDRWESGRAGSHLLTAAGLLPHTLGDSHLLILNITTWKAVTPVEKLARIHICVLQNIGFANTFPNDDILC